MFTRPRFGRIFAHLPRDPPRPVPTTDVPDALRDQLQRSLGATYALERELGGGGMSRVFVGEETSLGRKVVVKVLPPELAASVNVERFRREIQLAARLQASAHRAGPRGGHQRWAPVLHDALDRG